MTENKFFKKAENLQAYLKAGFLGFAGSGKTYTACAMARGLHKLIESTKPVFFIDTETGSDYTLPLFQNDGIELSIVKNRAFVDLLPMAQEAESNSDILIIDSISAFWEDLLTSYMKKKNQKRLTFQDWNILKPTWREFTDWYVNSKIHVLMCGRAGWTYDYFKDDDGSMELHKTGTKMKAETEIGFEPSLLIEMERVIPENGRKKKLDKDKIGQVWVHRAHILKDRTDILDGKNFDDPTFADFAPVLNAINLGGEHFGVDVKRDSQDMFTDEGKTNWRIEQEQKEIELDEIQNAIIEVFPGQSKEEKRAKILLLELVFNCKGWEKVKSLKLDELKVGKQKIDAILIDKTNIEILLSAEPDVNKISWAIKTEKEEKVG